MAWVGVSVAVILIAIVFLDAFESMMLPRRVAHSYRLARQYYRSTWLLWRSAARHLPAGRRRNGFMGAYGPLSLLGLFAVWAIALIGGFALMHWSLGSAIPISGAADESFATYLYFSGTTFFTLGYGDLVPATTWARALSITEAGLGFAFLAVVISYLPVLYQAFSRREITIALLDARAGSPPTAGELLRRLGEARNCTSAGPLLMEWERWSAELLESHLSYPVLSYYRSQHDNQSWVAALTTILDTSALLIAGLDAAEGHQARLTFAMARHAAVDLALVFQTPPRPPDPDRLPPADLGKLYDALRAAGLPLRGGPAAAQALAELRALYEPFVNALAVFFELAMPPMQPAKPPVDDWQTSAWTKRAPGLGGLAGELNDEHFD
jgi:hypothetical protein